MSVLLTILYALVAAVVLIESLNKIQRTDVSRHALRALTPLERVAAVLRAAGWSSLLLAAGGLIFASQLPRGYLEAGYALAVFGSACLVARSRVQEEISDRMGQVSANDAFERTQVYMHSSTRRRDPPASNRRV
jgi:hypothetical protein